MCIPDVYNSTGSMSYVFDSNSPTVNIKNIFQGTGTPFTMSLYSPDSLWASTVYNCYIYSPTGTPGVTAIGLSPLYTANYEFHY
jgi:putative alpha-1,2-mannosidase